MKTHLQLNIEFDAAVPNADLGLTAEHLVESVVDYLTESATEFRIVSYSTYTELEKNDSRKKKPVRSKTKK